MPDRPSSTPQPGGGAGLCDTCVHQQVVRNTRGSSFSLCRRSREEPETYLRYPRLPVIACPGHLPRLVVDELRPGCDAPRGPGSGR